MKFKNSVNVFLVVLMMLSAIVVPLTPMFSIKSEALMNITGPDGRTYLLQSSFGTFYVYRDGQTIVVNQYISDLVDDRRYADPFYPAPRWSGNDLTVYFTAFTCSTCSTMTTITRTFYNVAVPVDTTPPIPATFSASPSIPTNGAVYVSINYPSDATIKEYKNGLYGAWQTYTSSVYVGVNNTTIYARSKDSAGNMSSESNYTVTNIDNVAPSNPSFTPNITATTNQNVLLTINYPSDANQKQYKIGYYGSWNVYTSPLSISSNDTIYARAIDSAGNYSGEAQYSVSNIDKVAPITPTLSASISTLTNSNVVISISYASDAIQRQYKIGNMGNWQSYSSPISLSSNENVYARSYDQAGNASGEASISINNIDKLAPTSPIATVNENRLTIVPGTDSSGIQSTLYQLNGEAWTPYTSVVTLADGNYIINVKSVDFAGNESAISSINTSVSSIDYGAVEQAVVRAEDQPTQANIDFAQVLINGLPTSTQKSELEVRLEEVRKNLDFYNLIRSETIMMNNQVDRGNATLGVVEMYKLRVIELRNLVDTLPTSMDRPYLKQELDVLYNKLLLIEAVLKTNQNGGLTEVDLDELQDKINELPDGDLKNNLQEELNHSKDLQDAIEKVEQAEQGRTQGSIDTAREAVNKLPDGQAKEDLLDRLNAIQKEIDDAKEIADKIVDATDKVERAEGSKSKSDVDTARDAVNQLPNGPIKDELNDRLDSIQKEIDDIPATDEPYKDIDSIKDPIAKSTLSDVERYVALAEKYKTKTWIVSSLNKLEALPDLIKSNPIYAVVIKDLTDRVNKLKDDYNNGIADQELQQKITTATNYVAMYEKYKSSYYKTKAQTSVNELPDGEIKSALQARINAVK